MIKILLEAPILTQSGYGEHARLVYQSLSLREDTDIYISPLVWGSTPWMSHEQSDMYKSIQSDIQKMESYIVSSQEQSAQMSFDLQVHVGIPSEFKKKAPYSVCVTAGIETDRVAAAWLLKTHKGIDKLVVPSVHARNGFVDTRYEILEKLTETKQVLYCNSMVEVVPYPVKNVKTEHLDFSTTTDFNFLSIAMLGPRKNIQNMVKWFCEEFRDDNVGLILKTSTSSGGPMDKEVTMNALQTSIPTGPRKCKIYLVHGNLEESEVHSLYNRDDVHCYVTSTHGEGFGLPIFEAACYGMPVIATDWSAHVEFLTAELKEDKKKKMKKAFARVEYDLKPIPPSAVWKDILVEGSQWAYPKERSFKSQMRKVYKNYGMYKKWATSLQSKITEEYSEEKIMHKMNQAILYEGYLDGFAAYRDSNNEEDMKKNWDIEI